MPLVLSPGGLIVHSTTPPPFPDAIYHSPALFGLIDSSGLTDSELTSSGNSRLLRLRSLSHSPAAQLCTTIRHVTTILKTRVSGRTGEELSACCGAGCSSSSSLAGWSAPPGVGVGGR
ncbi:hypothetical protein EYF80_006498 [Liparis tanakae]|uniref:Uncharacterized protein n=1 Tax=Liparis tanakae TaxID=230148 RepID=A0A4Z2IYU3_9TELE|nr:hypothetical protein EYF80_006498 [Liparis tanakae]